VTEPAAGWWSRPTLPGRVLPALFVPAGLTAALLFAASRFGCVSLLPLACLTAAPIVVAMVSRPDLGSLRVLSRMPYRSTVGETVGHGLVVRNDGRGWSPPLTLTSEVAGFEPLTVAVPPLAPGGSAVLESPRPATARALSDRHLVRLRTGEPFGLIEREVASTHEQHCLVHPAPAAPVEVPAGGEADDRAPGVPDRAGSQPHGVREWRPGDSFRRVHWRGTARHGRLVVVEPERPGGRRVALLVQGSAGDDRTDYEAVLARAAATAVEALRRGDEVLLTALGPVARPTVPQDATAALDWFSGLRWPGPQDAPDLAADPALLTRRISAWAGRGGVLVLAAVRPTELPAVGAVEPADRLLVVLLGPPGAGPPGADPAEEAG
jgi:uncharacterized protein (DUF58 family)